MRYLYEDFLTDRAVYSEARRYWESMCLELLGSRASDWEIWRINKGAEDGNPILAMLSRRLKKAVRIIQVPPRQGWESITSWIDKMGDDLQGSMVVDELVIHGVLSVETAETARQIMGKWFDDSC